MIDRVSEWKEFSSLLEERQVSKNDCRTDHINMINALIKKYDKNDRDKYQISYFVEIALHSMLAMEDWNKKFIGWKEFSKLVEEHIVKYTIPQYGDSSDDRVSAENAMYCIKAIEKYVKRYGKNMRGDEEQVRDFLKIAHYAALAWGRWNEGNK